MGGEKKKKHFVDTSVRVNTVTKETKEENNSKNDGPSKSSKLVIEIPPGYIKLFKRNPDYTIIINEANSKHFIPLKHKSLMDIFKMQSKEPETLANYIYDVTDILTINIVSTSYQEFMMKRRRGLYRRAFSKVLQYDVKQNEASDIMTMKQSIDNATKCRKINIEKLDDYFAQVKRRDKDIENKQEEVANKPKRLKGGRKKMKKEKKVFKIQRAIYKVTKID